MIAKSIAQCRVQVSVVKEAAEKEPGEMKFEGVMWHGGYDQSIISSAARAPHTAPILPGPLPFDRYTSAAAEKTEKERNDERRTESHDALTNSPAGYDVAAEIERDSTFCVSYI